MPTLTITYPEGAALLKQTPEPAVPRARLEWIHRAPDTELSDRAAVLLATDLRRASAAEVDAADAEVEAISDELLARRAERFGVDRSQLSPTFLPGAGMLR